MEAVVIVTALALIQYVWFGVMVGGSRGRTGVKAPAMSGDQQFERMNRVHQNTLEQLIVLLPSLWLFAHYVNPMWGAYITVVYLLGRFVYRAAYLKDPSSRTMGFVMSFLPAAVMLGWTLVIAIKSYFST